MNCRVPVLILNGCEHGNLGIARSLGALGVSVNMVHPARLRAVTSSRWLRRSYQWDLGSSPIDATFSFLKHTARQLGTPPLLIPADDHAAVFVAEHAVILRQWFMFPEMCAGLVRALASKKGMYELAMQYGVPTPRCFFPESEEQAAGLAASASFPVMLKRIDGTGPSQRTGVSMTIVHNECQLLRFYRALGESARANLMIQEYIPGGSESVWMFNGYFSQDSRCLISFTGQKLRQWPIHAGTTSLGICAKNDMVESTIQGFMTALGYKGMIDVGTRYDARDGAYKVLDVNPRIGSTFRLFVDDSGLDVVRAFYRDMTGQPVKAGNFPQQRKWIVEDIDLLASLRLMRSGDLSLKEWARSFRGVREYAYSSLRDPVPLPARILSVIGIAAKRFRARVKSESRRHSMLATPHAPFRQKTLE